jgi:phosphoribosylformylglycinamidine synthase
MQTGAVIGIQDMGAAGLTCSTCEMGGRGGVGLEIELDLVPQRETGMTPYEIMLSESQERMLLVAEKGREDEVFRVFQKWGLDAVTIGRVIDQPTMRVLEHGQVVAEIPNASLTDDAPVYQRPLERWEPPVPREMPEHIKLGERTEFTDDLKRLLASPNICSKRWVYEQYDSMVQTNTVEGPGAEGGVIRVKETNRGLAMALDGNSRWCYLDPKLGAMHAVAESARNVACTGATPIAATNCLNFGNPERPEIMAQLVEAIEGLSEACTAFSTPITGGNVSLYNETLGEGIYPTPVIGIVGLMKTETPVTIPFKNAGRSVILLGGIGNCDDVRFGSSQFAKEIVKELWGLPPALDVDRELRLQAALREIVSEGLAESAHDLSDGGLAVALAECALGPAEIGAQIDIDSDLRPEVLAFHEGPSRVLISTALPKRAISIAERHGIEAAVVGVTIEKGIEIRQRTMTLGSWDISSLKSAYTHALESQLTGPTTETNVR